VTTGQVKSLCYAMIASRNGPAHPRRRMPLKIIDGLAACKSGCAIDDNVVFAVSE
jgi:hypothetical protein